MKNVELMNGYYLEIESGGSGCITLKKEERRTDKSGGEKLSVKTEGYYSTFGGALMGFRRKAIKNHLSQCEGLSLAKAIESVTALDAKMRAMIVGTGLDCGEERLI